MYLPTVRTHYPHRKNIDVVRSYTKCLKNVRSKTFIPKWRVKAHRVKTSLTQVLSDKTQSKGLYNKTGNRFMYFFFSFFNTIQLFSILFVY